MDVHTLLRRVRANEKDRAIARTMKISRTTVKKCRNWFTDQNLLSGPLPDLAELHQRLQATFGDGNPGRTTRRSKTIGRTFTRCSTKACPCGSSSRS